MNDENNGIKQYQMRCMQSNPLLRGERAGRGSEVIRDPAAGMVGRGPYEHLAYGRYQQGHLVVTKEQGHPPPPSWCVNGVTAR